MELILKCSEPGDRLDEKLTKSAVRQLPRIADMFTPKHRPATSCWWWNGTKLFCCVLLGVNRSTTRRNNY